jgi:hypothetical protein
MGLTWALAWFSAGMVLLLIVGPNAADVPFPLFFGLLGFLAGTTFSAVLGMVEGGRRLDQLSLSRFAGWGGVAGLLLSVGLVLILGFEPGRAVPFDYLLFLGPIFSAAGATCAAGSLALARRADGRGLLDTAGDPARVGLAEDSPRKVLE